MRIIIGFHAIEEAIKNRIPGSVLYINRGSHKRNDQLIKLAKQHEVKVVESSIRDMDLLANGMNHRGAVLTAVSTVSAPVQNNFASFLKKSESKNQSVVIALDGVTDPHNLGAVLRSADMFSVDLVLLPERRSATINQTVLKVSSGAAEYVPYTIVPNMVRSLQSLQEKGYWVYGADMNGSSISSVNLTGKSVIVLGAEGKGLSRLVTETCDRMISIPTKGHIDSLNISVAAGIIMYEVNRQIS